MKNSNRILIFAITAGIATFSNFAYSKGYLGQCKRHCIEGKRCEVATDSEGKKYEYCKTIPAIKDPTNQNSITADPNATPRPQ